MFCYPTERDKISKQRCYEFIKNAKNVKLTINQNDNVKFNITIEGQYKQTMNNTTKDGFSQKQLNQLKELLEPIKSDIKELKDDVNQLKQDVNKLKIDVEQLKVDVKQLKEDVTQLKTDVKQLQSFHKNELI